MTRPFRLFPADDYVVRLEVFQGPLDLLLHLIEREELPITSVSLTRVTGQYMDYLATLEQARPEGIAEFLVMAARLLYIKSVALLPRSDLEPDEEEEEDPGEALARQLREYKLFKEKAAQLQALEGLGRRAYPRMAPPPRLQKRLDPAGADVQMLLEAINAVLETWEPPPQPLHEISALEITIGAALNTLRDHLSGGRTLRFRQFLVQARSRTEIIVSFLAVLEMIKQGEVRVQQDELFGDIVIEGVTAAEAVDGAR